MLPKTKRFSSSDFDLIKKEKPQRINTDIGFFLLYESLTPGPSPKERGINAHKKAIIVPKKIFKRAVDRNKYKRLFFNNVKGIEKTFIFHPKKIFTKEELVKALNML